MPEASQALTCRQRMLIAAVRRSMAAAGHRVSAAVAEARGRQFYALGLDERARQHARAWRLSASGEQRR